MAKLPTTKVVYENKQELSKDIALLQSAMLFQIYKWFKGVVTNIFLVF